MLCRSLQILPKQAIRLPQAYLSIQELRFHGQGPELGGQINEKTEAWIPACAGMTGGWRSHHLIRNHIAYQLSVYGSEMGSVG